jgi:type I restriction enzyme M protein
LTDTNLHTIIRLPQSTFFPATVSTNLLFFEKGSQTKEIWYYEHRLPEGQKSYSKTKPIQFDEFAPIVEWWNNRVVSDVAWKIKVTDLKDWDLDIKNPKVETVNHSFTTKETIEALKKSFISSKEILSELENLL